MRRVTRNVNTRLVNRHVVNARAVRAVEESLFDRAEHGFRRAFFGLHPHGTEAAVKPRQMRIVGCDAEPSLARLQTFVPVHRREPTP